MSEYAILQNKNCAEVSIDDPFSRRVPYAMAYVRSQTLGKPFRAQEALAHGTAFPCLVMPFDPMEVCDDER